MTEVYSVPPEFQKERRGGLRKPTGLWVSVEGPRDWKEWCEGEQWGLAGLACATEVVLSPKANVLRISGEAELDRFHAGHSVIKHRYSGNLGVSTAIDWTPVARQYQGIIIAPYVWSRRLDGGVSDWYYGWDCASGCIWDAAAVSELRPMLTAEAA